MAWAAISAEPRLRLRPPEQATHRSTPSVMRRPADPFPKHAQAFGEAAGTRPLAPHLERAARKHARDPAPPSRLVREWRDQPATVERLHRAVALLGHPRLGVQCAAARTLGRWSLPAAFDDLRRWYLALPSGGRHLTELGVAIAALCACAEAGQIGWLIAQIPSAPVSQVSRRQVWLFGNGLALAIRRLGLWAVLDELEHGRIAGHPVPRDLVPLLLVHARPPGWSERLDALAAAAAPREAVLFAGWRRIAAQLAAEAGPDSPLRPGSQARRAGRLTLPRPLRPEA